MKKAPYINANPATPEWTAKMISTEWGHGYQQQPYAKELADHFGADKATLPKNLWKYLRKNIAYKPEAIGKEVVQSPNYTANLKTADCEDFALLVSCILRRLNISHKIRLADYDGKGWQHVYVVTNTGTIIDPVNATFNSEYPMKKHKDFAVSKGLSGIELKTSKLVYPKGLTPMEIGRLNKSLDIIYDWGDYFGKKTYRQLIEQGLVVEKEEVLDHPFYFDRLKFHRMNWREQEDYEKKFEKKILKYRMYLNKENSGFYEIPKIVYNAIEFQENEPVKSFPKSNLNKTDNKDEDAFVGHIFKSLTDEKLDRNKIKKIGLQYGLEDESVLKELTELAIVKKARWVFSYRKFDIEQTYQDLVELYKNQPNLSLRTSNSILLQQYSTPVPIAFLMGIYCKIDQIDEYSHKYFLEPSAGNGMLTVSSARNLNFVVNEIDEQRYQNLKKQGFARVVKADASTNRDMVDRFGKIFNAVITNPPFGALDRSKYVNFNGFEIKDLDHLMSIRALDCMKDNGHAAIIIGGHTKYDDLGRIEAGKNRTFLNYLYHHYYVDDIININGDLYSRMGTSFDIRLILINGRKPKPEGVAPLANKVSASVVNNFEDLKKRVMFYRNTKLTHIQIQKLKEAINKL